MMTKQKKLALCGMFTALAVSVSVLEGLSGVNTLIPIPGVKLGLANIAVLFAVIYIGKGYAFSVVLLRCLISLAFFGNASGFIISLCGGLLSLAAVVICFSFSLCGRFCTLIGVSAFSAFFHALGQLLAVSVVTGSSDGVFTSGLMPIVLALSVFTGIISGAASNAVYLGTKRYFANRNEIESEAKR